MLQACLDKSLSAKIKEEYEKEGYPESDASGVTEETLVTSNEDSEGQNLKKRSRTEIPWEKRYVHVDRKTREKVFACIAVQRCSIVLMQCDACRSDRDNVIIQVIICTICNKIFKI